jgi:hypothetical protein
MLGREVIDKNETHFSVNIFLHNSRKLNVSARSVALCVYFLTYKCKINITFRLLAHSLSESKWYLLGYKNQNTLSHHMKI